MQVPAVQSGNHRQILDNKRSKFVYIAASGSDCHLSPPASAQI